MTVCKIFKGTDQINRIVADEAFAKMYCEANGYTYEMEPAPPQTPDPEETYTADDLFTALLGG